MNPMKQESFAGYHESGSHLQLLFPSRPPALPQADGGHMEAAARGHVGEKATEL